MTDYIICVFGSGGVGKSCLTMQFIQGIFVDKYHATIEDRFKTSIEVDEKTYSLEILDTAGSDEFAAMRDSYIKDGHGFVLVYSITSLATFNDIQGYYDHIMNVKDNDGNGPPAIVLVGNKTDLDKERVVSRESGHALANKWQCSFLETSAKDRNSVTEIFFDLIRQLTRRSKGPERIPQGNGGATPQTRTTTNHPSKDASVTIQSIHSTSQASVSTSKKESKCCVLL